jgi:hypothetical protein|tara:strand:+ start:1360 stop:1800 length:441 start_codon:yes stop_codon:yes gene_type:complete
MKNYYYIPYLYNISESLIDEFNLHLDRKRNDYYSDEEYPNNYIVEEKRYMNKNDLINLKRERYNKNNNLLNNLSREINNMINFYKDDFDKKVEYQGYLYKIQNEIYEDNIRLYNIINNEKYLFENKYYSIKYLILFLLFFVIINFV